MEAWYQGLSFHFLSESYCEPRPRFIAYGALLSRENEPDLYFLDSDPRRPWQAIDWSIR